MTKELMDDLGAAITTREELNKVMVKHRLAWPAVLELLPALTPQVAQSAGIMASINERQLWPLQRDMVREKYGYYPAPTEVLKWLRSFRHLQVMFPHISRDDLAMVAFTGDMESAVKDKKVRISMGRFLKKFFPLFTDDAIRQLEALHRAELDPTLEIVRTAEEIAKVYMGGMVGDSGCMRHSLAHFGHHKYHPSAVYSSPGFGVAIHRDATGRIKSRSVVWENPDNASDKRFLRIYGDNALQRKLERAGYHIRGLRGAKFTAIRDPAWSNTLYPDRFVMPYIDPAGGIHYAGDKSASYDARCVVRYDDEPELLHLINNDDVQKLRKLGIHCVDCGTQNGSVSVPMSSRAEIMATCMLSGKKFSRLEAKCYQWMDAEGKVGWVLSDVFPKSGVTSKQHGTRAGLVVVYGLETSFVGKCLPPPYETCIDSPETMRHMRLCRLSEQYHPGDNTIRSQSECIDIGGVGQPCYIMAKDAYMVMEHRDRQGRPEYTQRHVHRNDVKMLRKMGYVSVQPLHRVKVLVHKNDDRLVRTASGRQALKNHHDLHLLYDGQWEFARNVVTMLIGNFNLMVMRDNPAHQRDAIVPHDQILRRIFMGDDMLTLANVDCGHNFMRYFGRFLCAKNGQVVETGYVQNPSMQSMVEAARLIVAMTPEQVDELHYSRQTLGWARSVLRTMEMDAANRQRVYDDAEANAREETVWQSVEGRMPVTTLDFETNFSTTHLKEIDTELLRSVDSLLSQPQPHFMRAGMTTTFAATPVALTSATTSTGLNPASAWPYPPRPGSLTDELIQQLIDPPNGN